MKSFLLIFVACCVGCQALNTEIGMYYDQAEVLHMRMTNGDVGVFDEPDVWGRKWVLIESRKNAASESVEVLSKYKSCGATASNECDDFDVTVLLRYIGGTLDSLSYSYAFEKDGSLIAGGAECDF